MGIFGISDRENTKNNFLVIFFLINAILQNVYCQVFLCVLEIY